MSTEDRDSENMDGEDTDSEAKANEFEAEHNKLLEDIMALPEAARSVKLLSSARRHSFWIVLSVPWRGGVRVDAHRHRPPTMQAGQRATK